MVLEDNMASVITKEDPQSIYKLLLCMEGTIVMEKALHIIPLQQHFSDNEKLLS